MISILGYAEFELQLQQASRGVDCKWKCRSDSVSVSQGSCLSGQLELRENVGQDIRRATKLPPSDLETTVTGEAGVNTVNLPRVVLNGH